ncbi:MAG: O-methyltransferase [Planctomycetota bacterium]
MSASSTQVSAAHFAYLAERCRGDDDFLRALKVAAVDAGIPEIQVAPEQIEFMAILLGLIRAQRVVEVGTLAGYSAIGMARALPAHGKLFTCELEPRHAAFAREWIGRSDVAGRVEVLEGRAADFLGDFPDGSIDAVFLDADKAGYPGYLEQAMRFLRPGGLMMADNAFAFGQLFDEAPTDREVPAVRRFNDFVPTVKGLRAVITPVGDGLWVGIKEDPGR